MKRCAWFLGLVLSVAGVVVSIAVIQIEKDYRHIPSQHPIGNRTALAQGLKEKGFPFSFLVISDTHNDGNAYALLKEMVTGTDASFLIHVGDAVSAPDIWMHRYFIKKMTEDIKPPFPVFLAPGNHDIDYGFQRVPENQRVSPELYRSLYGATSFDFAYNNCLFILCGVDLKKPDTLVDDLRGVLSKKAEGKKHIFVFIHYPPRAVISGFDFPREQEFLSLLKTYKVTTCFFGHYHGYHRNQINGTNMIVLGGGGGSLKRWQSNWGKFHHGLKITVGEDTLTEDIMVLQKEVFFHHSVKWGIVVGILPLVQNRVWMVYVFLFLFSCCTALPLWVTIRKTGRPNKVLKG
jgi:predicted phosphodiesterase